MKTLVIGGAGGFGGEVARELERRGHFVRALGRPGGRRPSVTRGEITFGDALDPAVVDRAMRGMDSVVWGFHLPYPEWVPGAVESARITAETAARHGATVLFPGNLYGLGGGFERRVDETIARNPRSTLGHIRNEIEGIFERATEGATQGRPRARVIVLRCGDYLGPRLSNSWFDLMTSRIGKGGRFLDPGMPEVPHAWAYLPDVARAGVLLLEAAPALSPFETVHFEGYVADSRRLLDAARSVIGAPARKAWRFPWWVLKCVAPFSEMVRHILSVRYLWDEPVVLDGAKLRRLLPTFTVTPLEQAIAATLGVAVRVDAAPVPSPVEVGKPSADGRRGARGPRPGAQSPVRS